MSETETVAPFLVRIPDLTMVVLIGTSGSGKSTFAARHFLRSEILSSDKFREMVSDDETDQAATVDAFAALHYMADLRLRRRKLVVIDATNVQAEARRPLLEIADRNNCHAVAIVLDVPERVCHARNRERTDRQFGPHVVANQSRQLRQSLRGLKREGFRYLYTLEEAQIERAQIVRDPLWTDRRTEQGPFDILGDLHGCHTELVELLGRLGYVSEEGEAWRHPEGRRAVFVGDLVDRGPAIVATVRLVQGMVTAGSALCVPGNHDIKLTRALKGDRVTVAHGLAESLAEIEALPDSERDAFKKAFIAFTEGLVSHAWLDEGRLCVAHAGMKEAYMGRASGRVREFALFGETTGETDEFGLPIRYPWAQDYRGATTVVYGHTPVPEAEWLNNTLNLDTGCVFGGKLTALRWPEREIVQVPALAVYADPVRPLRPPTEAGLVAVEDLFLGLLEAHRENRNRAAAVVAVKNLLQTEIDREESRLITLIVREQQAREDGNLNLEAGFHAQQAPYQEMLEKLRAGLTTAVEATRRMLHAIREEEQRLRDAAATAGIALSEEAFAVSETPDVAPLLDTSAVDSTLEEALQEMKEIQIQNREAAVKAVTAHNNLRAELDRVERMIARYETLEAALREAGNHSAAIETLRDREREIRLRVRLEADYAAATEAVEAIKDAVQAEEEQIRRRTGEALMMKADLRRAQIDVYLHTQVDGFQSLHTQERWTQWELALTARRAGEDAPTERRDGDGAPVSLQWQHDELLRAEDVLGKRHLATRLMPNILLPAENAGAALEVMSRFAVEPRWLIYLPPTMSPCETAPEGALLERPAEAFAYYQSQGVEEVICQRKHMGSRAVVVLCRDAEAARRRFGAVNATGTPGQCYTRTGRQFFDAPALHAGLLQELGDALTRAGFWEEYATDWVCLDCELMPWNAKAQSLLREQYAPVGAAARTSLSQALVALEAATARGLETAPLLERLRRRQQDVERYTDAYARYCWEVRGLEDIRLAPFHLLATEGKTYFERDHAWHMAALARLTEHSALLLPTESLAVVLQEDASTAAGDAWWQELTGAGGEGMVVKPKEFIVRGPHGPAQPAVKVRGREYLRIIYGPEYTELENLERLRRRSLGRKRSLALREFALGVEGLERFVRKEPLRRVHECVFGVLALESEPVDPRL